MTKKQELITRLIREGVIDFADALLLMENDKVEVKDATFIRPATVNPPIQPVQPYQPLIPTTGTPQWWQQPQITCDSVTVTYPDKRNQWTINADDIKYPSFRSLTN
jgi:hypothetical protein